MSNVKVVEDEVDGQAKYVEIAMAVDNSDNENDGDGTESEADFYRPVGLSPMQNLNELRFRDSAAPSSNH